MGDGCEVKYYKGEILITLVLVLNIIPLAVIYIVIYIYITNGLKLGVLLTDLGWVGVYKGLIVLAVFIFLGVKRWSSLLESLLCLLYILTH